MQFRKEVQEQFKNAGWFPDRNVKETFDTISGFNEFPTIAKDFLYEYGDLEVEMLGKNVTGIFNTQSSLLKQYNIENYLNKKRYYGHIISLPLAYYDLDNATIECDAEGKIYVSSDGPNLMSNNFIEGIERVIMEDYSEAYWWDDEKQKWSQEDMFA
jgi:SUKH-3 immunity protein